jgi:hypothetical protein
LVAFFYTTPVKNKYFKVYVIICVRGLFDGLLAKIDASAVVDQPSMDLFFSLVGDLNTSKMRCFLLS